MATVGKHLKNISGRKNFVQADIRKGQRKSEESDKFLREQYILLCGITLRDPNPYHDTFLKQTWNVIIRGDSSG